MVTYGQMVEIQGSATREDTMRGNFFVFFKLCIVLYIAVFVKIEQVIVKVKLKYTTSTRI